MVGTPLAQSSAKATFRWIALAANGFSGRSFSPRRWSSVPLAPSMMQTEGLVGLRGCGVWLAIVGVGDEGGFEGEVEGRLVMVGRGCGEDGVGKAAAQVETVEQGGGEQRERDARNDSFFNERGWVIPLYVASYLVPSLGTAQLGATRPTPPHWA